MPDNSNNKNIKNVLFRENKADDKELVKDFKAIPDENS